MMGMDCGETLKTLSKRLVGTGLVVVGFGTTPYAQTTPAPPIGDPPATFRSGVTLVRTDVIVRDADGAFIPDLTAQDFQISEDGVPQEIASLVLVHGGRVFNQLAPPPPVQEGIVLPSSQPVDNTAGRIIIFFIDAMHLEPEVTPKVRHFIKEVADVLVHEGDLIGLISNGADSTATELTYNRAELDAAADNIIGIGYTPRDLIETMAEGRDGPPELRWRAHRAFWTVNQILGALEDIEDRRKVLLYISTGYDLNPFQLQRLNRQNRRDELLRERPSDLYASDSNLQVFNPSAIETIERQGVVFADGELIGELDQLTATANRANTTFYTMDPRGLISAPDIDYNVPLEPWLQYMSQTRSSLRTLAELTGGMALVNTNNFDELLRRIDAETSDYYVLGFYTNNPDPTNWRRELDVTVNREDVSVQSRGSYTFGQGPAQGQ